MAGVFLDGMVGGLARFQLAARLRGSKGGKLGGHCNLTR
jgi:hypothetical protein